MSIEQALRAYCREQFSDDDVMRSTGLSLRAWRELLRARAVRTISQRRGRSHVRLCDSTVLKRSAAISAVNQAGLSLAVSGQVAYFWPFHTILFTVCDPRTILQKQPANITPGTGELQWVDKPKVNWFDAHKSAIANPGDWLLEIYEGRFVGARYGIANEPVIFGDLRDAGTSFVAWFPTHSKAHVAGSAIEELSRKLLPYHRFVDFVSKYENFSRIPNELKTLGYKYERRGKNDSLRRTAADAVKDSLVKITVNPTLAIKKALRRLLGLEPGVA